MRKSRIQNGTMRKFLARVVKGAMGVGGGAKSRYKGRSYVKLSDKEIEIVCRYPDIRKLIKIDNEANYYFRIADMGKMIDFLSGV